MYLYIFTSTSSAGMVATSTLSWFNLPSCLLFIFPLWCSLNKPLYPELNFYLINCSHPKLFSEALPNFWNLAAHPLCTTRRKRWQVPQELARLCCWPGCWPAKLISHSPGIHNASRVTMGINRRSQIETETGREGQNIRWKIFKDSISLTWVKVLAMGASCSFCESFVFKRTGYWEE